MTFKNQHQKMTRFLDKSINYNRKKIADLFVNSENQLLNHGIKRYLQI